MGLNIGKTRGCGASRWSDLPQDIAGLILCRLPSHADRLSFGAVCHDWRLAAELQQPPAMLWASLGGGSYHWPYRFAAAPGKYYHLSFGSWLLYGHRDRLLLRHHAPGAGASSAIEIPCSYHECTDCCDAAGHDRSTAMALMVGTATTVHSSMYKIVVCSSRSTAMALMVGTATTVRSSMYKIVVCSSRSTAMALMVGTATTVRSSMYKIVVCSSHLLAAILYTHRTRDDCNFAFFRPGALSWALLSATDYSDIAFHRGQIFAVSSSEELFVHEKRPATATGRANLNLVVSSDETKLLMVRWSLPSGDGIRHDNTIKLQVFEADLEKKEWAEVKDLGDQVLFISDTCSRAVGSSFMEQHTDSRLRGGNRVFLPSVSWLWLLCPPTGPCRCCFCEKYLKCIPYYCVYDMTSGTHSVVSLTGCRLINNPVTEWFFPY
ncbi:hypothetical protein VPH35_031465 [Triticum aestivum]